MNNRQNDTSRESSRKSAVGYRRAQGHVRDTGSIRDAGRSESARSERAAAEARTRKKQRRPRRVNPIRKLINDWFDRVMGAVSDGGLADQDEEYAAGRTSRDFAWNSIGQAAWGMVFPILTIVVTQISGAERAGMFSFAFVVANLLYIIGTYGVRTYQVSDLDEYHSFVDYQVNRIGTCLAMLLIGFVFCRVVGYEGEMLTMCLGIFAYKAFDALGEVYEGRLQQVDKLYLGGISLALRSVVAFALYAIALLVTGNLGIAAVAMAIGSGVTFLFVTFPLTLLETPRSMPLNLHSVALLFKGCFPVFLALFLYALIDNMPKFVMQGANLPYDNQLYFNALYFPAQAILITVQLIYRPMLVKMAHAWADESRRSRFDLLIIGMVVLIIAITVAAALLMAWIGIPVMGFLYGIDFTPYSQLAIIMLAAGGLTAAIDFLYQVITILRRQQAVIGIYLITFGFSLLVLILMTTMMQIEGAIVGYLIVMAILFILLVREYIVQRLKFSRSRSR